MAFLHTTQTIYTGIHHTDITFILAFATQTSLLYWHLPHWKSQLPQNFTSILAFNPLDITSHLYCVIYHTRHHFNRLHIYIYSPQRTSYLFLYLSHNASNFYYNSSWGALLLYCYSPHQKLPLNWHSPHKTSHLYWKATMFTLQSPHRK